MTSWIKFLLAFEAVLFATASLVHAGLLIAGYEHSRAATAEGMIAAALVLGIVASAIWPLSQRIIALIVQGFALLGTLIGAFTIAIGMGPQTDADHIFHGFLLVVLIAGLVAIVRSRAAADNPTKFSKRTHMRRGTQERLPVATVNPMVQMRSRIHCTVGFGKNRLPLLSPEAKEGISS